MGQFIVTGPDGKRYKVTGDNAEGAVAAVKKMTLGGLTGADAMRARGLKSDPTAANAQAEQAIAQGWVGENPAFARAASFTGGLPFVGEWYDEALGAISPEAGARLDNAKKTMTKAHPVQDAALRFGGTVAGTLATAGLGLPSLVGKIPGLGLKMLAGGGAGAAAGAADAASSAAGAAAPGERSAAAAGAAPIGAGLGFGVGALAPAAAKGASAAWQYLKGKDIATISQALGISPSAAKAVKAALDGDDLATAARNIQRGGPNAMLVEAGPATQGLGSATMASGGKATAIMREGIDGRMAQGAADVRSAMDDAFKPGTAVIPQPPKIGTAYDNAYRKPIDYSAEPGRRIEALLPRVPKEEWAKARKLIEMDPDVPEDIKRQFLISIQPDGSLKQGTLPSVMELDYVTRSLNDTAKAGDGKGALGGNTNQGRLYGKLSQRIREQVKASVPEYGQALDFASTEIGIKEAREFGETLLRPSTSRTTVYEMLRGAPEAERLAAKAALRQAIDDQLANTRRIMSRPGTDVGEAIRAVRELSSRAARDKLAVVLGPQEATKLTESLDEAATAFEIGAALSRNSDTAIRQAVQGSVDASTTPGLVGRLMAGEPLQAGKRLAQIFTGATPEAQEAVKAGIYTDIAKALTSIKGQNAERALTIVNRAIQGQKLTDAQAIAAGRLVATVLGSAGYREGSRMLSPRTQ